MNKAKWEDITDMLTEKGVQALMAGKEIDLGKGTETSNILKVGAVMKFQQPLSGTYTSLRITRIDKKRGKLWAVKTIMMTVDEAEEMDRQTRSRAERRHRRKGNTPQ